MSIYRIAVDGPAGSGKSTLAKLAAQRLGIDYIDTGAMYRALALKILRTGTDYNDPAALAELLADTDVDYAGGKTFLDGEDVSGLIRTQEVSEMASASSAIQKVRDKLVALQQAMGKRKSLIMDGRDIATKVFPDAELKFYVTARSDVRAQRRAEDMKAAGQPCDPVQIQQEIEARDHRDMHREVSPLTRVPEAVLIDTSDHTLEESLAEMMGYIDQYLADAESAEENAEPAGAEDGAAAAAAAPEKKKAPSLATWSDKRNIVFTALLFLWFIVFTVLVCTYDVAAIGPEDSRVGFSSLNAGALELMPYNEMYYIVSKLLGYLALVLCGYFALTGVVQLIRRKSLRKVDPQLVILGIFYAAVIAFYVMFDKVVVNYRPILEDGVLESSYPSSHTMLAVCVFLSAITHIGLSGASKDFKKISKVFLILLTIVMVFCRMASGVHWLTDIIGGLLLSAALLMMYRTAIRHVTQRPVVKQPEV